MKYVKLQMTKEDTKGFITNHQELIGSMVLSALKNGSLIPILLLWSSNIQGDSESCVGVCEKLMSKEFKGFSISYLQNRDRI